MIAPSTLAILFVVAPIAAVAQGSSTSSSHLKLPVTARSAALGEGTVADPGQLSSWLLNPANLYYTEPDFINLTHAAWIQEVQGEHLSGRFSLASGSMGVAVSATSVPGIEIRDVPGPPVGTFSARFATFQLGYAQRILDDVVLGASSKYLYEKIYKHEATGFGVDVGITYRTPIRGFSAAFAVTNLGSLGQFRDQGSDLPGFTRLGASYSSQYDDFDYLISTAWAQSLRFYESHLQASLEASYKRTMTARFGYQTGYDSRGLSAGIGFRYEFIQFDYAYVPFSLALGDGHLFSLGFRF